MFDPVPRPDASPRPSRRIRRAALLCTAALVLLGGAGLEGQVASSRAAVSAPAGSAYTHFFVDGEQSHLVHRGHTTAVGRAGDQFTSWLELPAGDLAVAAVRSDDGGRRAHIVLIDGVLLDGGSPARHRSAAKRSRGKRGATGSAAPREVLLPSARGVAQATPRLLAPRTNEQAFGVVWFEGSSLSQRELFFAQAVAAGDSVEFTSPVRLARRAPGSQVALDAVTLPDGRYLATWSAFDGTDTEILFTVGDGASWSRPRPLHPGDDAPDSFPTLIATPEGALVAWNSLEGHSYAVMTAAFDGSTWSTPRAVVAEPGAEPEWSRGADRPLLSFRQSGQWTLVETDTGGRLRRVALVQAATDRPTVLGVDESGVTLRSAPAEEPPDAPGGVLDTRRELSYGTDRVEWRP